MDETLKTRIIAALRESARCARSAEQQAEAMALVEALTEDAPSPPSPPPPAAEPPSAPHDEARQDAQATVASAEAAVYEKVNEPAPEA